MKLLKRPGGLLRITTKQPEVVVRNLVDGSSLQEPMLARPAFGQQVQFQDEPQGEESRKARNRRKMSTEPVLRQEVHSLDEFGGNLGVQGLLERLRNKLPMEARGGAETTME